MAFSLPALNSRTLRGVNRKPGLALTTMNKESAALGVRVMEGEGNFPKVVLPFSGGVTSLKVSNGRDLVFVRPDAVFNKKKPISGGIPHGFRQSGPRAMRQAFEVTDGEIKPLQNLKVSAKMKAFGSN